jgi:hypothetical protein
VAGVCVTCWSTAPALMAGQGSGARSRARADRCVASVTLTRQGMRPGEYPADPYGALEGWARARWPAAGQRLHEWSYQVRVWLRCACARACVCV